MKYVEGIFTAISLLGPFSALFGMILLHTILNQPSKQTPRPRYSNEHELHVNTNRIYITETSRKVTMS